jgi:hypothetical protein
MLVSFLAYSSTLNMEATCSSETSADFQRTTRHYIAEDRNLFQNEIVFVAFSLIFTHRRIFDINAEVQKQKYVYPVPVLKDSDDVTLVMTGFPGLVRLLIF